MQRPDTAYWDSMAVHGADAAVIDPSDRRGHKNAYITALRTRAMVAALADLAPATVLEFGCGSGGMLRDLAAAGHRAVGADIARELLAFARQRLPEAGLVLYDGLRLPLAGACVDAVCSYVVLNHVLDDDGLARVLLELHRVLRAGGRLAVIEQVRRRSRYEPALHTHRRSPERWHELFAAAGFARQRMQTLRFGHFPAIYAVRYGLVPRRWHAAVAAFEAALGRVHPVPWLDYADTLFVYEKPRR